MRQSTGSLWILSIVLTFIMIFTAYLAVTVNYAKAFKIKNNIISIIENKEGVLNPDDLEFQLNDFLVSNGYDAFGNCDDLNGDALDQGTSNILNNSTAEWDLIARLYPNKAGDRYGVCIYRKETSADDFCGRSYYRVITFFKLDLPYLGNMLTFSVKGNTSPIYDVRENNCIN